MNLLFAIDKGEQIGMGDAALYSLLSIIIVFAILFLIIGITTLVFKINGLFDLKKELEQKKEEQQQKQNNVQNNNIKPNVDIKDEDMMVAVFVASIDYQEQIKKDVRVVSVREI